MNKPKEKIVKISLWDCGLSHHNHIKYIAAKKCIEKQKNKKIKNTVSMREKHLILKSVLNNVKTKELAKKYNVVPGTIIQRAKDAAFNLTRRFICDDDNNYIIKHRLFILPQGIYIIGKKELLEQKKLLLQLLNKPVFPFSENERLISGTIKEKEAQKAYDDYMLNH